MSDFTLEPDEKRPFFEIAPEPVRHARIAVIGVGGGGGNAINTMIASKMGGVEFMAANTDAQVLECSLAPRKIQLGQALTHGLGAGGDPEIGRKAALEDTEVLTECLQDLEMVFVTAGMGGGTGTGAAPVIARIAKEAGVLTVGVVTRPFEFEGKRRKNQAEEGIAELRDAVNTLITIPNHRLLGMVDRSTAVEEAFQKANDVLLQACKGIADLIITPGLVNLDFADVRAIMRDMGGKALMGSGTGHGENRAVHATQNAINSPLLEEGTIEGSRGVLISITGGEDLSLYEVNEVGELIHQKAADDANVIFGAVVDPGLEGEVRVTVIATGFGVLRKVESVGAEARATGTTGKVSDILSRSGQENTEPGDPDPYGVFDEENLDVPAFLRRQAD